MSLLLPSWSLGLLALLALPAGARAEEPTLRHLVVLERTAAWPAELDAAAQRAVAGHRDYVGALFADGRALYGGPAPDASYGVIVLAVSERAEVDRIFAADPGVQAGLLRAEVRAFHGRSPRELAPQPQLPATESGLEPVRCEVVVKGSLAEVWKAWSTSEGASTFFAPRVELELAPLGKLDVLFFPEAPAGMRGAEGLRILAFAPERMLAFEWNAPPQYPRARAERTFVVVELEPVGPQATRVTLLQQGFDEQARRQPELAQEWREVRAYFARAWPSVLGHLERRFESGPLDWAALRAAQQEQQGAKPAAKAAEASGGSAAREPGQQSGGRR